MPISDYFASSYSEARKKFRDAAKNAGASLASYTLPNLRGPDGEELVTDVARIGRENIRSVLVLISATHGVEGFCGSGCQVGYFIDQLYEVLPSHAAAILVHAINPFGFAWLRRVNEDNVDLNRNFQNFREPLPSSAQESSTQYESVHDWLIPDDWEGPKRQVTDSKLQQYLATYGMRTLQEKISVVSTQDQVVCFMGVLRSVGRIVHCDASSRKTSLRR